MRINPYSTSPAAPPPLRAGRDELRRYSAATSMPYRPDHPAEVLLLHGQRGMSKTVLAQAFRDMAREQGWHAERVRPVPASPCRRSSSTAIGSRHSPSSSGAAADPGCVQYTFSSDLEKSGRVHVMEQWESNELLRAHMAAPHSAEFVTAMQSIGVRSVKVTKHEVASSQPLFGG